MRDCYSGTLDYKKPHMINTHDKTIVAVKVRSKEYENTETWSFAQQLLALHSLAAVPWWVSDPVLDSHSIRVIYICSWAMKPMSSGNEPTSHDQYQCTSHSCWSVIEGGGHDGIDCGHHEHDGRKDCPHTGYAGNWDTISADSSCATSFPE